jgi:hypothetical protein
MRPRPPPSLRTIRRSPAIRPRRTPAITPTASARPRRPGAFRRASDGGGDELILFTCTGAPARAFYDALGPWSVRLGTGFLHDGRSYRSTAKVQANMFGVDSCSVDASDADPRCVITFNAGDFLDGH